MLRRIVMDVLSSSVVVHKRRCAIRSGVRESVELEAACVHQWDDVKRWCRVCGLTCEEIVFGKGEVDGDKNQA